MKRFFQRLHGPWSASHNRKDPDLNIMIDYCNTQNAVYGHLKANAYRTSGTMGWLKGMGFERQNTYNLVQNGPLLRSRQRWCYDTHDTCKLNLKCSCKSGRHLILHPCICIIIHPFTVYVYVSVFIQSSLFPSFHSATRSFVHTFHMNASHRP